MRQETFTLSQKELQRVSVISTCIKGDLACASAAELLSLSVRQIKHLKKRMREAELSCAWPAPSMLASTTTISPKSSMTSRAFLSAARLCAASCATKASARPANVALLLIASAACARLAKAN